MEFKRAFESDVLTMAASRPARKGIADPTSADTKTRILDAAELLFMEHGFEATSLRSLTSAASVNLAAVNYHFGSKEELFQAVLTRRLDPMNQERIDLLERVEREAAGKQVSCEKILSAMLIPALRLARVPMPIPRPSSATSSPRSTPR